MLVDLEIPIRHNYIGLQCSARINRMHLYELHVFQFLKLCEYYFSHHENIHTVVCIRFSLEKNVMV